MLAAQDHSMIEKNLGADWIPLNKREKLSLLHILGIASGNLVSGMLWNIIFALLEPYVSKLQISSIVKTLLLLYGSLIGFILGPLLGVYSDGITFKWGRRRIFVIIGGVLVVFSLLIMMYCVEIGNFFRPDDPHYSRQAVFIVAVLISFTAGNIVQSPARTMCSDVTPINQQSLMANICQVYSGFSGIFANILGGLELYKYTPLEQEQFLLVVSLSIAFIAITVSCIVTKEEPLREKPPKINPFKQIWTSFRKMPRPFARVLPSFTFSYIASYQYTVIFSHFMGNDLFHGNNSIDATEQEKIDYQKGVSWSMMCNVMNNAFQLIYGFINTKVCEKVGMRAVMIVGNLLLATALLLFFFIDNKNAYLSLTIPLGLGTVIYMAIPYAIVSLCIPTEELGNNLGILNCFGVFGQQVSNWGIGKIIDHFWKVETARKKIGISSVFGFLATIFAFWIVQPTIADTGSYAPIPDLSQDVGSTVITTESV
ncbi:major facilitator superfamily transporter [Tritrichomonas foetus]|uniref:Major facilitator superfamily transporter n=1 Tax=Tritrichomonas foetus TaxID=1144522 RepID=A0A1J4J1H5_9EUKA|nr:major facilitator superfamily transporter [Tritrichomonas foetus]|eukprot:OHS93384.1 major facilitator superfamily transporter [Tritrichomonas foetus]